MQENSLQSQVPKTYLPFHLHTFWDSFYKNHIQQQDSSNINWYFDLTTFSTPEFSLKKFSKEDEILLVGAGLSSTLDYFDSNGFDNITIFDFSEELANILKNKYNKGWDIMPIDIRETKTDFAGYFNVIIDKGCLDCILSDPKDGENKFITALTNLALWLDENNGVLYYFSNGKMEDRSQLFFKTDKIKYKGYMIDMNETMKEEYKEFNKSDNVYYLYIITRAQ
jgi:L-rhamnose mutarotase